MFVKAKCPHCSGPFEFPKDATGAETECPHCSVTITLVPEEQKETSDSPPKSKPEIQMDHFSTSDGSVFARFTRSPNGEYLLLWRDEWAGGRSRTKGPFYLFRGTSELCKGNLSRPNGGQVADNGSFVFCDWLFTQKLASAFYAFDSTGQMLIEKKLRANLFNAAISKDGVFAACQTAVSPGSRHSEVLTLFDLRSRSELWHISPPFWPETYEFNTEKLELTICSNSTPFKSVVFSLSAPPAR